MQNEPLAQSLHKLKPALTPQKTLCGEVHAWYGQAIKGGGEDLPIKLKTRRRP